MSGVWAVLGFRAQQQRSQRQVQKSDGIPTWGAHEEERRRREVEPSWRQGWFPGKNDVRAEREVNP